MVQEQGRGKPCYAFALSGRSHQSISVRSREGEQKSEKTNEGQVVTLPPWNLHHYITTVDVSRLMRANAQRSGAHAARMGEKCPREA